MNDNNTFINYILFKIILLIEFIMKRKMSSKKLLKNVKSHQLLILMAVVVGGYFLYTYSKSKGSFVDNYEGQNVAANASQPSETYKPSPPDGHSEPQAPVNGMNTNMHGLPPSCVKQSVTDPRELLPRNTNSEFSKLNPAGSGDLQNVSLLQAGTLQGINTVGTSLRNANLQLRSEPANPRVAVGPWNNTTITSDNARRDFEIGN